MGSPEDHENAINQVPAREDGLSSPSLRPPRTDTSALLVILTAGGGGPTPQGTRIFEADPGLLRKPPGQSVFFATACSRAPSRSAGTAMVEIVTSLFIVTFGVFSVLTMYHVGMAKTRAIRDHDLVMNALQNELDGLRAMPFENLPKDWNGKFRATKPNFPDLVNVRPHLRIKPFGEGREDLLEVTVSIRWSGEHGRLIKKSLTTLIADKPTREL